MEQFADTKMIYHPMHAALAFAYCGNQVRIRAIVEEKARQQREIVNLLKQVYFEHIPIVPRSVLHMMKGRWEHAETELRFLERLAADAAAGRLNEVGLPLDE